MPRHVLSTIFKNLKLPSSRLGWSHLQLLVAGFQQRQSRGSGAGRFSAMEPFETYDAPWRHKSHKRKQRWWRRWRPERHQPVTRCRNSGLYWDFFRVFLSDRFAFQNLDQCFHAWAGIQSQYSRIWHVLRMTGCFMVLRETILFQAAWSSSPK